MNIQKKAFWAAMGVALRVGLGVGWADAPGMIHYQGRLALGTNLYSGSVSLVFRMYDASTGGVLLHTSTNAATAVDGLYATVIGQHGVIGNLDAALTNAQVWLEVQVNGSTLSPRERLLAVPYARVVHGLRVLHTNNIVLNADVGSNMIGDESLHSAIGGGAENRIETNVWFATISGGEKNQIQTYSDYSSIGGGRQNWIEANTYYAAIGGGNNNLIQTGAYFAVIGGGSENIIHSFAYYAAIGGGSQNQIHTYADGSTIGGGWQNAIQWSASNATISGGSQNRIQPLARYATIGGGVGNEIQSGAEHATIGGGSGNRIRTNSFDSTIGGGAQNIIHPYVERSTIGGGGQNEIQQYASQATIAGGQFNQIHTYATYSSIGGGYLNQILPYSFYSSIAGGYLNLIESNASYSTIAGGGQNRVGANADYAFASGNRAHALHEGAFVWSDNSAGTATVSTNANSVTFRAAGGYRLFSNPAMNLGVRLDPNATAWAAISDREAKENIQPLDTREVLEGVKRLPLSSWEYKADPGDRRYIGPMAQDFQSAFGLGDDKTINTLDADGVLFAAVQALALENDRIVRENEQLNQNYDRLAKGYQQLLQENTALRARLEAEAEALREELETLKRAISH